MSRGSEACIGLSLNLRLLKIPFIRFRNGLPIAFRDMLTEYQEAGSFLLGRE